MADSNCPNCNAVLSYEGGLHCDYCGARFEEPDWVTVYEWGGKPVYSFHPHDWPSPQNLETR